MAYFLSNNVRVFPSTYRTVNASGKFTSETNFTNMIKALAGKDSFVVDLDADNTLKVVVKGYYFEIKGFSPNQPNVWLRINVDNGYLMSLGGSSQLDDASNFLGIESNSFGDLQVTDENGRLINKGYIDELCDEKGNWYDLDQVFDVTYDNTGKQIIKLKPGVLSFEKATYINNFIAQYATALYDSEGKKRLSVGNSSKFVYFDNGIPKVSNATIGSNRVPIWLSNGELKRFNGNLGSRGMESQSTYIKNGELTAGQKITISTSDPGNTSGTKGDLWFVIQ